MIMFPESILLILKNFNSIVYIIFAELDEFIVLLDSATVHVPMYDLMTL